MQNSDSKRPLKYVAAGSAQNPRSEGVAVARIYSECPSTACAPVPPVSRTGSLFTRPADTSPHFTPAISTSRPSFLFSLQRDGTRDPRPAALSAPRRVQPRLTSNARVFEASGPPSAHGPCRTPARPGRGFFRGEYVCRHDPHTSERARSPAYSATTVARSSVATPSCEGRLGHRARSPQTAQ